jgi:hypothetical protein
MSWPAPDIRFEYPLRKRLRGRGEVRDLALRALRSLPLVARQAHPGWTADRRRDAVGRARGELRLPCMFRG